jgi:hypothetical protein
MSCAIITSVLPVNRPESRKQKPGFALLEKPVFHQLDHPSTQFAKSRHAASGYSAK